MICNDNHKKIKTTHTHTFSFCLTGLSGDYSRLCQVPIGQQHNNLWDCWCKFCPIWMPFQSPNQQHQSTKGINRIQTTEDKMLKTANVIKLS